MCSPCVMRMDMPVKTSPTYEHTYVRWKHLVTAFQMCVTEAVHVGMSPVRQKWCQEPLREKHVSAIHHCCAGSQMSPAPAACLPPFALPPLAHLSTALHWRRIQVAHSVWIVIVGFFVVFKGLSESETKVLTWESTCMGKKNTNTAFRSWLCDITTALPSTDTASSAGLNTPLAAGRKHTEWALKYMANPTTFSMRETITLQTKTMKQKGACPSSCTFSLR